MANEGKEGGSGFSYFLTGTIVGAVLGVLFAPKEGGETREQLMDWLKQRREKGAELLEQLKEESSSKKEAITAAARAAKETYRETVKHGDAVAV